MDEQVPTLVHAGARYVAFGTFQQQVAENAELRAQNTTLLAENSTLKAAVKGLFEQVAPVLGLEQGQQQVCRRAAQQQQQQHLGQNWELQKVSGPALVDDVNAGTEAVQIYRIVRTLAATEQQEQGQQQVDPDQADIQPLFRPYDAVQLATKHTLWQPEKANTLQKKVCRVCGTSSHGTCMHPAP